MALRLDTRIHQGEDDALRDDWRSVSRECHCR